MPMPVLIVYPKKGDASILTLSDKRISIGRTSANDIILSDNFSSSSHAAIVPKGDGYAIQDLGSKNGTFLNGIRVNGESDLRWGDEILIGSTRIVFDQEFGYGVKMVEDATFAASSTTVLRVGEILKNSSAAALQISQIDALGLEHHFRGDQKLAAILIDVSQALIFHMELNKLLDYIMDLITQNIPMDRGILMLMEGQPQELVPKVVRVQGTSPKRQNIVVSKSILRTVMEKNSSILISDVQSDKQLSDQQSIVAGQTHSAMCVPLWNNREIIGLIYSDREALHGQFTEEDLRLLTVLANLAALKIENTRLFEESLEKARMEQELMMAQKIQRNLMPQGDPVFDPLDITGNTWPCRHIGGDYFDFIPMDPSGLGLVIADVSGHGVGAAFLMASLRASLYALIPSVKDLALLASRLNDIVYGDSDDDHAFISFFLGVLNRDTMEMTYVNAGHDPPLLINSAGNVRTLAGTGFCLGMFPSVSYETKSIRIEPDEILCLYTDGIVEGRNPENEEYGTDRLCRQLCACSGLPAQDVLNKINEGVRSFSASDELGDDMTLIIVKKKAAGAPIISRQAQ
jgi:sigma-B regulation protein RsbU (phosphoserine phosphatase)